MSLVLATLISTFAPAHAGWTQPAGAHYAKLGVRGTTGDQIFPAAGVVAGGQLVPGPSAQNWSLQLYGEYGLADSWTGVLAATPVGWADADGTSTIYTGMWKLGLRRGLVQGDHNLSVQADVGYAPPVGETDITGGALDGYVYVPVESTVEAGAQLQYGVGIGQNWVSASAGGAWRSAAQLLPMATGSLQVGRTTQGANRWSLTLPVAFALGDIPAPANYAGVGNTRYVGFILGYTHTFGQGWGVGTSFQGVAFAAANHGALTVPLHVEHQGS